jgi:DNA-binding response OmpR family regulator
MSHQPDPTKAQSSAMPEKLQRLTYVEDEPDIRSITEFALKEIGGYQLDVCASGTQALAQTPDFRPDLIILDVMMPGMDGIETFNRLRAIPALAMTPIVFMTAKTMSHELELYRSMGAADVIPKPFDPLTLSDRISEIWTRGRKPEVAS